MTTTNKAKQYQRYQWDDPSAWTEDGRLRDGIAIRIPVHLMDSTSKEVHDAALLSFNSRHRPGFRVAQRDAVDDFFGDARQQAYDAYDREKSREWIGDGDRDDRGPHGFGETGMSGPQVGDTCTVRSGKGDYGAEGSRGTMQMVGGVLTCVADPVDDAKSMQDHRARMQKLYAARDAGRFCRVQKQRLGRSGLT